MLFVHSLLLVVCCCWLFVVLVACSWGFCSTYCSTVVVAVAHLTLAFCSGCFAFVFACLCFVWLQIPQNAIFLQFRGFSPFSLPKPLFIILILICVFLCLSSSYSCYFGSYILLIIIHIALILLFLLSLCFFFLFLFFSSSSPFLPSSSLLPLFFANPFGNNYFWSWSIFFRL